MMQLRLDFLIQWPEHMELAKTMPVVSRQNLDSELDALILLRKKYPGSVFVQKKNSCHCQIIQTALKSHLVHPLQKQLCLNSN